MFDERTGGANLGGRSVTMFGDALIIIKSLAVVCAGQIENNKTLGIWRIGSRFWTGSKLCVKICRLGVEQIENNNHTRCLYTHHDRANSVSNLKQFVNFCRREFIG